MKKENSPNYNSYLNIAPSSWCMWINHAQLVPYIKKLFSAKGLCKNICWLLLGFEIGKNLIIINKSFMNKKAIDLNMFGTLMKDRILAICIAT